MLKPCDLQSPHRQTLAGSYGRKTSWKLESKIVSADNQQTNTGRQSVERTTIKSRHSCIGRSISINGLFSNHQSTLQSTITGQTPRCHPNSHGVGQARLARPLLRGNPSSLPKFITLEFTYLNVAAARLRRLKARAWFAESRTHISIGK
ncbi:hypothetical protein J6590_025520 [Homalodisca vitripennis]|nr:hypothetical protein J6590_025520 [Homalodisca vitripennis]